MAVVDGGGCVKSDAGVEVVLVIDEAAVKVRAALRELTTSGKKGVYFKVLNHASL
ncbi:hypothetical protein [Nakamurella antarctica]|uniref:hypothetical protein n=1 Tax=Nakamurella antarctica TaxID=1902245 RepID=UPI0013DDBEE6|nr:hypothetical protein [Nakamurella antarctica]